MTSAINRPARVGVITDQTGALSFMGIANANVAKMLIDDINARGGLLGRSIELFIEDSATEDGAAESAAARLVEEVDVDVILGGIYSSTRQAIKGPAVDRGQKLYIYLEQYEGEERDPLIFCTGPVPAQQVDPFFPWLMQQTGARKFYMPSADYIWPHTMNKRVRSACSGMYRGLKLWEAAVNEAGSLDQADVIGALDHARIAQGPGGPAEMVPGQHHVRMNMYIARSEGGTFKVVKNLGHIDPKEGEVGL